MKQVIKFSILTAIVTIAVIGCGGSGNRNAAASEQSESSVETPSKSSDLTFSITPLDGWSKRDIRGGVQYTKDGASFIIMSQSLPSDYTTPEAFLTIVQEELKKTPTFAEGVFSPVSKTKLGGHDAFEFTASTGMVGMSYKNIMIYIFKGSKAYSITYGGLDFDSYANDFQTMINSYTLK
jgi:hypothetical protein